MITRRHKRGREESYHIDKGHHVVLFAQDAGHHIMFSQAIFDSDSVDLVVVQADQPLHHIVPCQYLKGLQIDT